MTSKLGEYLKIAESFYETEFAACSQKEHADFIKRAKTKSALEIHRMGYVMGATAVFLAMDKARDLVGDN